MSDAPERRGPSGDDWNLKDLRKSAKDRKLAGICGGLGEYTPIPSWLWRALFIGLIFAGGAGIIAYLVLWLCMPSAEAGQ